jgi:hypothetical protein
VQAFEAVVAPAEARGGKGIPGSSGAGREIELLGVDGAKEVKSEDEEYAAYHAGFGLGLG